MTARDEAERARQKSERERAQLLLEEQTLRAEAVAKDRFLAMLSHELRTPLTPILLTLSGLDASDRVPTELREPLAVVRRNVEVEVRLIDDLLDTTRIAHGKLHLQMEPVDVHEIIGNLLETASSEVRAARVDVELDLGAYEHHVSGDVLRLRQVFWNVLGNAIRHTPAGGRVAFASSNPNPRCLRVLVTDSGTGITTDRLDRIFEPFEQGAAKAQGGLGLGLAISRGIVHAHRGRIVAHSAGPGHGTTIEVQLDTVERSHATHEPASRVHRAHGLQILLVEDHEDSALALCEILRGHGHLVRHAASLAEAREHAGSEPFDFLISDIGLPDGSGLDVLEAVRARGEVRSIALSGYGSERDVARTREAGFDLHLTKPVDVDGLLGAIDVLVRSDETGGRRL